MDLVAKNGTLLNILNEIHVTDIMDNVAENSALLSNFLTAGVTLMAVALVYWLFYIPCNWKKVSVNQVFF